MIAHPIADIFPMLAESELNGLAADIKKNGQRDPILLFQGKILDGRNRYKACELAGVEPTVEQFAGTKSDALTFVWSTNFHRRHLTSSQAAMAIAERIEIDPKFVESDIEPLKQEAKEAKKRKPNAQKTNSKIAIDVADSVDGKIRPQ